MDDSHRTAGTPDGEPQHPAFDPDRDLDTEQRVYDPSRLERALGVILWLLLFAVLAVVNWGW